MFKKIVCITLVAFCAINNSDLFSMNVKKSKRADNQALQDRLAELRQRREELERKAARRAARAQAPAPEAEVTEADESEIVDPAAKAQRKAGRRAARVAAPAVQPDGKRVSWAVAGVFFACQGVLALGNSAEFGPVKNSFLVFCSLVTLRGLFALKNICQADIKPAWNWFRGWFPTGS